MTEIERLCKNYDDAPRKLLTYFFGVYDFYKVTAREGERATKLPAFNINGTLNKPAGRRKANRVVAKLALPSKLLDASLAITKKGSADNKFILTFDNGWAVSMRIHNKDSRISIGGLAWDVQLVGIPYESNLRIMEWD